VLHKDRHAGPSTGGDHIGAVSVRGQLHHGRAAALPGEQIGEAG